MYLKTNFMAFSSSSSHALSLSLYHLPLVLLASYFAVPCYFQYYILLCLALSLFRSIISALLISLAEINIGLKYCIYLLSTCDICLAGNALATLLVAKG